MLAHGTTTLEAKTGYGLSCEEELRLLRLTAGLHHPVSVVPTFLPLHVLPEDYAERRGDWIAAVIESLPRAAKLARYCDVACDPMCFSFEECLRVGTAARALGMGMRVHADQTGDANGALLAARLQAAAADHLDFASEAGLRAMAASDTVATLLPGVTLHLCEMTPALRGSGTRRRRRRHDDALYRAQNDRCRGDRRALDGLQSGQLSDPLDADGDAACGAALPPELCGDLAHEHLECGARARLGRRSREPRAGQTRRRAAMVGARARHGDQPVRRQPGRHRDHRRSYRRAGRPAQLRFEQTGARAYAE